MINQVKNAFGNWIAFRSASFFLFKKKADFDEIFECVLFTLTWNLDFSFSMGIPQIIKLLAMLVIK